MTGQEYIKKTLEMVREGIDAHECSVCNQEAVMKLGTKWYCTENGDEVLYQNEVDEKNRTLREMSE